MVGVSMVMPRRRRLRTRLRDYRPLNRARLRWQKSTILSLCPALLATSSVQIVPAVEGGARNANLFQRPSHRQGRLLNEPDA
jgi:hypothetical protein